MVGEVSCAKPFFKLSDGLTMHVQTLSESQQNGALSVAKVCAHPRRALPARINPVFQVAEQAQDPYIFTHKSFHVSSNNDRIIEVNMTSENPTKIAPGTELVFSYSVQWSKSENTFEDRFNRYLDYSFFEHQIHWFSIFNSFMMVIFLCGLVALILLRTLKKDYAKYTRDEDDLDGSSAMADDSGWKQVHSDVFRKPRHLMLFSALTGTGYQMIVLVTSVIVFAASGNTLYAERGGTITAGIVFYSLSSVVAGYTSGGYYMQHFYPQPAPNWMKTMLLTVMQWFNTRALCSDVHGFAELFVPAVVFLRVFHAKFHWYVVFS